MIKYHKAFNSDICARHIIRICIEGILLEIFCQIIIFWVLNIEYQQLVPPDGIGGS